MALLKIRQRASVRPDRVQLCWWDLNAMILRNAAHGASPNLLVPPHPEAHLRRAVRAIAMVGELHKRGFQRLRVMPYMAPSGLAWRCAIGPADHFYRNHGAMLLKEYAFFHDDQPQSSALVARYSSGQENHYFDWKDSEGDSARFLADKFVNRFSRLGESGCGWDYAYAGWFQRLLWLAEIGWIALTSSDGVGVKFDFMHLTDVRPNEGKIDYLKKTPALPLPPPGEAPQDYRG